MSWLQPHFTLTACAGAGEKEADIIDKPDYKSETGVFDIEALEAPRPRISGAGFTRHKKVLFNISYESVEQNRSNADLYVMNPDGSDLQRITRTAGSESNFVRINEGRQIAFTYAVEGVPQLFVMNADGSARKQVTKLEKAWKASFSLLTKRK